MNARSCNKTLRYSFDCVERSSAIGGRCDAAWRRIGVPCRPLRKLRRLWIPDQWLATQQQDGIVC